MPTASESIGEGEPWVLEVMGLPFPIADSGFVGGGATIRSSTLSIPICPPLFFFLPSRLSELSSSMGSQNMLSQRRSRSILSESHCDPN